MKTKTILYNLIIILLFSGFIYSQDDVSVINDDEYKFTIAFPAGWKKLETKVIPEKGVINYSLQKNNNDNGLMILAFKLTEVKDIDDFIYVLEKDASLNLPQRSSEFKDIEYDDYDGKSALYKDTNDIETIFYFRTKNTLTNENYAYMLRFITPIKKHGFSTEQEIEAIIKSFRPKPITG